MRKIEVHTHLQNRERDGGGRETTEGGEGKGGSQEGQNSTVTDRGGSC